MRLKKVVRRSMEVTRAALARRSLGVSAGAGLRVDRGVWIEVEGSGRVIIGRNVEIGHDTQIRAGDGATILIEDGVFISGGCTIAARDSVRIGEESMLGEFVSVRDHDHDPDHPPKSGMMLVAPVNIGARVWLAAKCSVVQGGGVGDDAVIGAHALVNRLIPENVVAVGVPARVVREKISRLNCLTDNS